MLKRMILINSANFQFADVDLSKEIFFVGDNASGKTTTTRALHFLYNGNGDKLGIPRSKSSFAKHYFPHDDSYIIYVFESFFIFTYKRSDTIRRWFSKQEFDLGAVIQDGKLREFKEILAYIKKASLKVKPDSIQSYTDIIYGKDKKHLDFCIAKIDNYKIFLEVFNMIFNVDKAIVTAIDIKKAIQKSLDRKDEVLTIDYDDFTRKLNEFSRAYNFFKTFDSNRDNLANALAIKDTLISLEQKVVSITKGINYRARVELQALNELDEKKTVLKAKVGSFRHKLEKIKKFALGFEKRVKGKLGTVEREIIKLEALREKFDTLEVEVNIDLASKFEGIKTELDEKKFALQKLRQELSSAQKVIEDQIKQLEYKKDVTIPNAMKKKFFDLRELENGKYEEDKLLIENEYNEREQLLTVEIEQLEEQIQTSKTEIEKIYNKVYSEVQVLRTESAKQTKQLREELKSSQDAIDSFEKELRGLKRDKESQENLLEKHKQKYAELRHNNAKGLANTRKLMNQKIANARAILNPIPNSFNQFLSDEIEDWERKIYPIIDKSLLLKSCDELQPVKLNSENPIGFTIDIEGLETIPTKDEAYAIIKKSRYEKYQALKNAKSVYKDEIAKLDEIKNKIIADIESFDTQIAHNIEETKKQTITNQEIELRIAEIDTILEKAIEGVNGKYDGKKTKLLASQTELETQRNDKRNNELLALKKQKKEAIEKKGKDREKNIENLKATIDKENKTAVKEVLSEITQLQEDMSKNSEDELINTLANKVGELQTAYNKAYDATKYLEEFEKQKENISKLPLREGERSSLSGVLEARERGMAKITAYVEEQIVTANKEIANFGALFERYDQGLKKYKQLELLEPDQEIETEEYLVDLIKAYEDLTREYANEKSKFRTLIDKLKKLEKHSLIEINFNNDMFDEVDSIEELGNIVESLEELHNFERNKYESEKKRRHNNFDTFLKNTIPSKLQSFDDLEIDFEKAKNSINRSLANADFGVIKNIRLETDSSKKRNDTIASLMQHLASKVTDTVKLYSKDSLFYYDIPKSVDNINDIQEILEAIKQKGANGMINLFDTIDLTISYTENGKHIENKQNIKDDSSSGGNILLKVAIAISILTRYAKKTNDDTPFFLIIDEVSKLQSKNQNLIKEYINNHGFKTLFITPDPAYPDPERALYYTFKNIQEEGGNLEIRQMNII